LSARQEVVDSQLVMGMEFTSLAGRIRTGAAGPTHAATTEWRWWHCAVRRVARCVALSAVFVVSSVLPGCDHREAGISAGPDAGFAIRDSAEIDIVENHSPEYSSDRFWRMDMEPEIVLGGGDRSLLTGDSAHLIWQVSGLARLEDGRVAVLSRGSRQLYLFKPTGELSRVMGGEGEGPGEFSSPEELQYLPPDTLAVWDSWFGPVSYFDTDGDLIRTRSVDLGKALGAVNGLSAESRRIPLADGSFVTGIEDDPMFNPPAGTLARQPLEFVRIDQEYATSSLGVWKSVEAVGVDIPAASLPVPWPVFTFLDAFLAAGADPPTIYVADGTADEIRRFSFDGRPVRIIRRSTPPMPVSDEAHRAWVTYLATLNGLAARGLDEPLLRAIPRRDFHPPVAGLFVDPEGYLWVSEWSAPEVGGPDRWSVFSAEGRWLGVLPAPMLEVPCHWYRNPCWMGTDFFLAVRRDELGRERVEGYRIRRHD